MKIFGTEDDGGGYLDVVAAFDNLAHLITCRD